MFIRRWVFSVQSCHRLELSRCSLSFCLGFDYLPILTASITPDKGGSVKKQQLKNGSTFLKDYNLPITGLAVGYHLSSYSRLYLYSVILIMDSVSSIPYVIHTRIIMYFLIDDVHTLSCHFFLR